MEAKILYMFRRVEKSGAFFEGSKNDQVLINFGKNINCNKQEENMLRKEIKRLLGNCMEVYIEERLGDKVKVVGVDTCGKWIFYDLKLRYSRIGIPIMCSIVKKESYY